MTLNEIKERLQRFVGRDAVFHHYIETGLILRVRITHPNEDAWYLSFGGCTYIQGPVQWTLGPINFSEDASGRQVVEDSRSGLMVVCRTCHLITEGEYANTFRKIAKYREAMEQVNKEEGLL